MNWTFTASNGVEKQITSLNDLREAIKALPSGTAYKIDTKSSDEATTSSGFTGLGVRSVSTPVGNPSAPNPSSPSLPKFQGSFSGVKR